MKSIIKFSLLVVVMLSLTSCWDFNREQDFKDAENRGKSILIQAESEKKAIIETARAENEASELIAKSRINIAKAKKQEMIIDAEGVAEANRIIGESLGGSDGYLKFLQIEAIKQARGTVYIPTEAGLPLLEARNR